MENRYIDLSHTIRNGEVTYKGLPAPIICDYLSREESQSLYDGDESFQIGKIDMVVNTGTYIDFPFHRYADGKDMASIHIKKMADLEGLLISVPYKETLKVDIQHFTGKDIKGKAVLIHTGWSVHWQSDQYFENHPFLTKEAAAYLKVEGAALVGIDSHNIDDTTKNARPVHSILLKNEILIVEHMTNLDSLIGKTFTFSAVPPKIQGIGSFPVRAYAKLE